MSALKAVSGWFLTWLGFGLLGLSILLVPQDAFADYTGQCSICNQNPTCGQTCCETACGSDTACWKTCCADVCGASSGDCYDECTQNKICEGPECLNALKCIYDAGCVNGADYCKQMTNSANCRDCACVVAGAADCKCAIK
jgi:hypothetical protein